MQGPSDLVRLADAAEVHPGLVQQAGSSSPARTPIKGTGQDLLSSTMPPILRPALVPRNPASHPYRAENQRLAARLFGTPPTPFESRQRDVEQLCLQYMHHITDTPLPVPDPPVPMSSTGPVPESSVEALLLLLVPQFRPSFSGPLPAYPSI
ncbi:hypothetical protein LENED_008039 [Lentinula edodes]|uniref:Uncharacterized protein n=1 Tax=Lentinula edodes TaxID=5353 RepID=A0A1Q3EG29_LENED|nr:hypothetical protein LENED_008039 [Lentinula edodes]